MARVSVICSDCNGKVSFDDPSVRALEVKGATFDCPHCKSLMVIENDYTTSNLPRKMSGQLALIKVNVSDKKWSAIDVQRTRDGSTCK